MGLSHRNFEVKPIHPYTPHLVNWSKFNGVGNELLKLSIMTKLKQYNRVLKASHGDPEKKRV